MSLFLYFICSSMYMLIPNFEFTHPLFPFGNHSLFSIALLISNSINRKIHTNSLCCSVAQSCLTLCNPMDRSMPGFPVLTISGSLLKLMFIELMMASSHLTLFYPLLLLPSVFHSIRVFFNESAHRIRWPKDWKIST